jgi:hypothetical protein
MGKVRTSANGYYRGIPSRVTYFGKLIQGNYTVVQPTYPFIRNGTFFNKSFNNIIYNNYS